MPGLQQETIDKMSHVSGHGWKIEIEQSPTRGYSTILAHGTESGDGDGHLSYDCEGFCGLFCDVFC